MTRASRLFSHVSEQLAQPHQERVACLYAEYAVDDREVPHVQAHMRVLSFRMGAQQLLHGDQEAGPVIQACQLVAVARVGDPVRLLIGVLRQYDEKLRAGGIFKGNQLDVEEIVPVVVLIALRKYQRAGGALRIDAAVAAPAEPGILLSLQPVRHDGAEHVLLFLIAAQDHPLRLLVCEQDIVFGVHMDHAGHRLIEHIVSW